MKKTFYSNGKLLLTGEYTVLDGAKALALPTRYGQYLDVEPNCEDYISWTGFDADGSVWYKDKLILNDIISNGCNSENTVTKTLVKILHTAHSMNPHVLQHGFTAETRLTFPRSWGLGTSSTLINNIASWFEINPYSLLWESFGGSGYDIACAANNTPIFYEIKDGQPLVTPVSFKPTFKNNLYFIYLNKKQDSRNAIASYRERKQNNSLTGIINNLTDAISGAVTLNDFKALIKEHEAVMSSVLGQQTVKQRLFPDFEGSLKSLGAWGGDFILAASEKDPTPYFKTKGFTTILPYKDMIL
ncbi:GYDIA family GHMP kinase [Flavobacterium sp.]|uniref:GYDIA family GHMP kinase n=1 Tax=Flavobacterium sp. TaxID=239 RepID=UPI00262043EE|nr:GYDIA family GHMP kinase [Flavobacterium sp.]